MRSIQPCPLPDRALLASYADGGAYTDCYAADIPGTVPFAEYVTAFYTSAVFKLERLVLKWAVSRPGTDAQAAQLGTGAIDTYAAWRVEDRRTDQMLLCDFTGRTRSWLMAAPVASAAGATTRLYFGSAVVPVQNARTGKSSMGFGFGALLWFHKRYSVALLSAACLRVRADRE
jgi:hypothetical protein